ncbi:hypothetical protein D3C72_1761840 [compost metagenome]
MKPSSPYSPGLCTWPSGVSRVTLSPSRDRKGFLACGWPAKRPGSKLASSRLVCPGNSSHRIGRMALLDSTAFHGGSTQRTGLCASWSR